MRSTVVWCALIALVATTLTMAGLSGRAAARGSLLGGTQTLDERFDDRQDDEQDDEGGDDESADTPFARVFSSDPFADPSLAVDGDGLARVAWNDDAPAFPGDAPGSLEVLYDASLPAGRVGFALPRTLSQDDAFSAAALFVIESEGFVAEPDGFFQISWGLWNSVETGLNRTGTLSEAADCFELIEFDWFPGVSPLFGGPFLSPAVFGRRVAGDNAFDNLSSVFDVEAALPLETPLMAVIDHRPGTATAAVQVYRLLDGPAPVPVSSAVAVVDLATLADGTYSVDSVGLTLWQDGFDGLFAPSPAVRAELRFHGIAVVPGFDGTPLELLHVLAP